MTTAASEPSAPGAPVVQTHPRRLFLRLAAIALALAGVVVCFVLVQLSSPQGAAALSSRLCAPSARVNCDYVLSSPWSRIGPFSAALLGACYFAVLAVWFAGAGPPNRRGRAWLFVPLGLEAVGLAFSIWFVYLMTARLPVWCTWCAATHVINASLFIVTLAQWPVRAADEPAAHPSTRRAVAVLGGAVCVAVMLLLYIFALQHQWAAMRFRHQWLAAANNADYIVWRHRSAPKRDIPIAPDELFLGEPDAAHDLVVFSDFECPNCFEFHRYAQYLVKAFPGSLKYVAKHFPLARPCNPYLTDVWHIASCDAALAAEAAGQVGAPREAQYFRQLLFANRAALVTRPYERLAAEAGLDGPALLRAMAAPEAAARLDRDIQLAHELGVASTPAIFLDGRRLQTWYIVTPDARGGLDMPATDALWAALLGQAPAATRPAR